MRFRNTETTNYVRCPTMWKLDRDGWRRKTYAYVDVSACVGRAVHHGCALVNEGVRLGKANDAFTKAEAYDFLRRDLDELTDPYDMKALEAYNDAPERFGRLYDAYVEADPLKGFEILDVEWTLPTWNTTIDVGVRDPDGYLAIADIKTKNFFSKAYRDKYIGEFERSWQMSHYCVGYGDLKNERVDRFYLILLDSAPKKVRVELVRFETDDERNHRWYRAATKAWDEMTEIVGGSVDPTIAADCVDKYGPCRFLDLCHGDGRDYVQKEKR